MWGGVGGWFTPQTNDPVGLKRSAVGLKIMRLFIRATCLFIRSHVPKSLYGYCNQEFRSMNDARALVYLKSWSETLFPIIAYSQVRN